MIFELEGVLISGKEVLPIIEGGKGVSITNGVSAGSFASASAVGTFSGICPDIIDDNGNFIPFVAKKKTRSERHEELVQHTLAACISQAKRANDLSGSKGRVHINLLWEAGGVKKILPKLLEQSSGLIHGITCGAGLPYKLGEIASKYSVYYYPIVSSMQAIKVLWLRAYRKFPEMLGGVVYEDPWISGGHLGLSSNEDPKIQENNLERLLSIRRFMNTVGLKSIPIIVAGGVWALKDWSDVLQSKLLKPIAFQFGTRTILTKENPAPENWKKLLLNWAKNNYSVGINKFSPTGFYSSAIENNFIKNLKKRSERQIEYAIESDENFCVSIPYGRKNIYIKKSEVNKIESWKKEGFTKAIKTPSNTVIFENEKNAEQILKDQNECIGCLSACRFSSWSEKETKSTGLRSDPRSYCISKTLMQSAKGFDLENNLIFSGKSASKFAEDPLYRNDYIPTTQELVDKIKQGE